MRATTKDAHADIQGGFSLIELLVAMTVTLIVTGAIYGLIAGGQNAFRREPELSDRQQNTRIGLATIEKDIEAAGVGLSPWVQAFTVGLDGVGPNNEDALEIITSVPGCPFTSTCVRQTDAGTSMIFETQIPLPACFGAAVGGTPQLAAAVFRNPASSTDVNQYVIGPLTNLGPTGQACSPPPTGNGWGIAATLQYNSGPASWRTFGLDITAQTPPLQFTAAGPLVGTPQSPNALVPLWLLPVQVVRYEIAPDPNDPSGDQNIRHLWRSITGGRTAADNFVNSNPPPGPQWQLVARGIQDLQVTYVDGNSPPAAPADTPQLVAAVGSWNTLVRQVNVTLSSRVAGVSIAGFSGNDPADPAQFVLGQLSSEISPRAALMALQQAPAAGGQQWK